MTEGDSFTLAFSSSESGFVLFLDAAGFAFSVVCLGFFGPAFAPVAGFGGAAFFATAFISYSDVVSGDLNDTQCDFPLTDFTGGAKSELAASEKAEAESNSESSMMADGNTSRPNAREYARGTAM